jgi:Icc-related predicted phosphoesterase
MKSPFQRVAEKEIILTGVEDIAIAGDVGCTGFSEKSKKVFDSILRIKTDLLFIAGDITRSGSREEFDEIGDFASPRRSGPIFALCGNHDNPGYPEIFGISSYALVLGRTVCVFLDNSGAYFKDEDLEFLKKELETHKGKKFLILFHIPPLRDFHNSSMPYKEWMKLRAVLDERRESIESIICAHLHGYYEYSLDGYDIFLTAGGGAEMIYDLPKGGLKIHNALKASLADNGSVKIEMTRIIV